MSHAKRELFVEGGGDRNHALQTECRKGFRRFLEKAGFEGRMPRIRACGSRQNAYDMFCSAISASSSEADVLVLLVDSEDHVQAPATSAEPWRHVEAREGDAWEMPKGAEEDHLHFMAVVMESWFIADKKALAAFFGPEFRGGSLPDNPRVEELSKADVYEALKKATRDTKKGPYGKGRHSFKILALIDPELVRGAAPYAERLLTHLDAML